MENKGIKSTGKTGIVPDDEINGSDADKAYNENGDLGKPDLKKNPERSGVPAKTDAAS